jgi:hypothetical protein
MCGGYANGRLKHTKTRLSTRAVPLQAIALEALDRLPPSENPILFPNSRGGRKLVGLRKGPTGSRFESRAKEPEAIGHSRRREHRQ